MKTFASLALASCFAVSAMGQFPIYDGFNYPVDSTLAGNPGWTPLNTGTAPVVAAGNLSVSGLASSSGNHVSTPGGNFQEAILALGSTTTTGTVFFSFAVNLSAAPTVAAYSFALATGNTNYGAAVWLQASDTGFQIGLSNRSNSTPNYASSVLALNQTHYVVGAYTFVEGTANDSSQLWINPAASSFGSSAPAATLSAIGGTDLAGISQFLIRGVVGTPTFLVDELRIGTSYASVTPAIPEPSTYAAILGLLVLAGAIAVRRRGRK
jgi:hypothetical protein